jgi:hypothetical protein
MQLVIAALILGVLGIDYFLSDPDSDDQPESVSVGANPEHGARFCEGTMFRGIHVEPPTPYSLRNVKAAKFYYATQYCASGLVPESEQIVVSREMIGKSHFFPGQNYAYYIHKNYKPYRDYILKRELRLGGEAQIARIPETPRGSTYLGLAATRDRLTVLIGGLAGKILHFHLKENKWSEYSLQGLGPRVFAYDERGRLYALAHLKGKDGLYLCKLSEKGELKSASKVRVPLDVVEKGLRRLDQLPLQTTIAKGQMMIVDYFTTQNFNTKTQTIAWNRKLYRIDLATLLASTSTF